MGSVAFIARRDRLTAGRGVSPMLVATGLAASLAGCSDKDPEGPGGLIGPSALAPKRANVTIDSIVASGAEWRQVIATQSRSSHVNQLE
jgi:hypothetical protein